MELRGENPLEQIGQTSKTILVEEFCKDDETPNLRRILYLSDVKNEKDKVFSTIEQELGVKSFEEFVEKFMPVVWEWYEKGEDPLCPIEFRYALEDPEIPGAHKVELERHEFYKMVMDLYAKKSISGESNLDFDYSRVAEMLSPRKILENAKQLRGDFSYSYKKWSELGEDSKFEKSRYARQIKEIRKKIINQYTTNFTGSLKLALADVEHQLTKLSEKESENKKAIGNSSDFPLLSCDVRFDEKGDLEVIPIEINQIETEVIGITERDQENKIAEIIAKDFDRYGNAEKNSYMRELVITNYSGVQKQRFNEEDLMKKKNSLTTAFKNSQEEFARIISSAVEKILNVKVFFDQATIAKQKLPASLIVTNCKANELLEDETIKSKFRWFIEQVEPETESKIWFAIIPAIGDAEFLDDSEMEEILVEEDLDVDIDMEEEENKKVSAKDNLIDFNTLREMLEILRNGKITTFFNYKANEKTGFGQFGVERFYGYRERLKTIEGNEYAVFTYPNFTILPKNKTVISIGNMSNIEKGEHVVYMQIPGIYVDSSYVAAGLVVGSQNPEYLSKKNFKVKKGNPCVRFDLEEGDNRFKLLTTLNREGKTLWASDVEEAIGNDMFGFCFCGNTKYYKGLRVKNTYVYLARNMGRNENGFFEPLYKRMTMDFIMQYLKAATNASIGNRYKRSDINAFLKEVINTWRKNAESEIAANNILQEGEKVILDEDDKFKITFRSGEETIDINIEEENKGE